MLPSKYQPKVGDSWYPWVSGNVDTSMLKMKQSHSGQPAYINGCQTYALKTDNGREWNVKEGWK